MRNISVISEYLVKKFGIVSVYLYSSIRSIIGRTLRCPHSFSLSLSLPFTRHKYIERRIESDNVDIMESFLF
jgi:hypothetical protein